MAYRERDGGAVSPKSISTKTKSTAGSPSPYNDFLRRVLFPGVPSAECVDGLVMFPWGTGPFWPVPCDADTPFQALPAPVGSTFPRKSGQAFVDMVCELSGASEDQARAVIARTAKAAPDELCDMTVLEIAKRIFDSTTAEVGQVGAAPDMSVSEYMKRLAGQCAEFDPAQGLRSLSAQTGLKRDHLAKLPLADLSGHLGVMGEADPNGGLSVQARTVVCGFNGQTGTMQCGHVTGALEGAIWGGIVGGVVGGGIGAAIGAVIGGLIGWLFGDDD